VLIPAKNKKELSELPAGIKRKLNFVCVSSMDEIIEKTLLAPVGKGLGAKRPRVRGKARKK
jgi:ATP-dependent Lon protease